MADIEQIIDALLKEKIGHHLLDSGGAYGYIYERNRTEGYPTGLTKVDFYTDKENEERSIDITIPIYDFLKYNLIKDTETIELEKKLFRTFELNGFEPYEIYEVSHFLKKDKYHRIFGIKETGITSLEYTNTYNYEEYLSQTMLYVCFRIEDEDYVLLEIHNGCDVRSGYTYPQLFKLKDIQYFIMGQFDRYCECECGLNDYKVYGSDDPTDSGGAYVTESEIYERTYVDMRGNLRCRECDSVIKGGFIEW